MNFILFVTSSIFEMEIESEDAENGEFKMRDRLLNGQHRVAPTSHDVEFIDAIKEVIRRFGPSCLAFQDNIILLINFLFIGMLDDPVAISAWGLAVFTTDITIVSIGKGLWWGIDTLAKINFLILIYTLFPKHMEEMIILCEEFT